ncbi:MAG: single-stranded DNA-binding protein [Solobacterium sp.]|nr:single-stranded DNA-binding protein [Solobacterium sp.]
MLSSCIIVGRVKEKPEIRTTSKGNTIAYMLVEVDRPFRNEDGTLTTDTFRVVLWRGIAEECAEHCLPGSVVAIRGRLQSSAFEKEENVYYNCEVIAEKVTHIR